MKFKVRTALLTGIALSMGFAGTAMAFEPGDWLVRVGASYVSPASDNHEIVSVESATSATFNFSYMMTDVWALEVLAACPFKHDLELQNGDKDWQHQAFTTYGELAVSLQANGTVSALRWCGYQLTPIFPAKKRPGHSKA